MARLFDDASSQYVEVDSAPVTAMPLTIAAWIYPDDLSAEQAVVWIGDKDVGDHYWDVILKSADFGSVGARDGGTYTSVNTSNTANLNSWNHLCGIFTSATDRRVVLNGDWASSGFSNASRTPLNADRLSIGRRGDSTPSNYFSGRIGRAAIWSVALNQSEVESLARGTPAWRIRPESLVSCPPIFGLHDPEIDLVPGRGTLTVSGSTRANGPPVSLFTLRVQQHVAAGPLVASVGQVNETDLAQAITARKTRELGQTTETDASVALTARKSKALGQAAETDLAQAVTARKAVTLGQALETDLAQPVTSAGAKTVVVGQVVETDTAQAIISSKLKAVGQTTETDLAQALTAVKRLVIGQAMETDTALGATAVKRLAVNQILETDSAIAISHAKALLLSQAIEIDLAQVVTASGTATVVGHMLATLCVKAAVAAQVTVKPPLQGSASVRPSLDATPTVNP